MSELTYLRTYTRKVYAITTKKTKYEFHTKHIHYKTGSKFLDINTTLLYDNKTKTYKHTCASYHPIIPQFSDDWIEFYNNFENANHTIKARPVCRHVQGTQFQEEDGNGVIYKGAFDDNIDLKIYSYWAGLKKVICINSKPADVSKEMTFDFELSAGQLKFIDAENTQWQEKNKLPFKSKTIKIGTNKKFSYFRKAFIWDSGKDDKKIFEHVQIELYKKNDKIYLRKTIPAEILQKATYPLYTDHPTSYYAGAGDGSIFHQNANWNTLHDATTGTTEYSTAPNDTALARSGLTAVYQINRGFIPIDTSGIPDGDIVTEAKLYIYCEVKQNGDNDGDDFITIVKTDQPNPTTLTTADFNNCGATDNPEEGTDTRVDIGDITNYAYHTWDLNTAGKSWVKTTAGDPYTMLGLREGHDVLDHPYAGAGYTRNEIKTRYSEYTGTGSDPYMEVTTITPTKPYPTEFLKKDNISGYDCFMQAYINAKIAGYDPLKLPDGTIF